MFYDVVHIPCTGCNPVGKALAEDDGNNEKEGNFDEDWSIESDEDGETRPPPNVRSKGGPVIKG
ncbi:hypothetical protein DCAR_0205851 [Daucus carota subsp. sativus]|uniref:Uncharacterized protein n=1 Tax=Daucus carota subsp. sativus TaxID=79200 RepID=A0A161Y519_DAUCS|nr:hypothetical protein DCAR_0205851 [Daucus carota subsp. sativus]